MTIEIFSLLMIFIAYTTFAAKRLLTYMHVLQQEDYDNGRLLKWMFTNKAYDKRLTLALLLLGGLLVALLISGHRDLLPNFFLHLILFVLFVMTAHSEKDPRKNSKKKLVATARAKRIFIPAVIVSLLLAIPQFFFTHPWPWIINVQLLPYLLVLVNICLKPFEDIIQVGYWREAHDKVMQYKPVTIGITGSYGKTSIKHILGHVLGMHA
ncbi:MAG: UDP-N-acetylmuramoyl-tripeptide--D-alanyl-D-alanine ligase, partial [Alphaproteobacteria bacterium]